MRAAHLGAALVVLAIAMAGVGAAASRGAEGCRIFRNGWVSLVPDLRGDCTYAAGSIASDLLGRNRASPVDAGAGWRAALAGVVALGVAAIPLLLVTPGSPARPALVAFHGCLAILAGLSLLGWVGSGPERLEASAWCFAPCALAHLLLTFPERRRVLRLAPWLARAPYLTGLVATLAAWVAVETSVLVWGAMAGLLLASAVGCGLLLVVACLVQWRESPVPIERARAATLVAGAVLVAFAVALLAVWRAPGSGAWASGLVGWLALVPVPVLLATSRYSLFDLRHDLPHVAARVGGWCLTAALVGCGLASSPILRSALAERPAAGAFGVALLGAAAAGVVRRRPPRAAKQDGTVACLETVAAGWFRGVAELTDDDEVARRLAERLLETLPADRMAVFGVRGRQVLPLAGCGDRPSLATELGWLARDLLGSRPSIALWSWSAAERAGAAPLLEAGVDLVLGLRFRGVLEAIALGGSTSRAYPTRVGLGAAECACSHAAAALANGRLVQDLVEAERRASAGRTAVDLAHDLGKELVWIRRIATRVAAGALPGSRAHRDLEIVADLADERARSLRSFVRGAVAGVSAAPGRTGLYALVARCASTAARRNGAAPPVCILDPPLQQAEVDAGVARVLGNLLDNACRAAPRDAPVVVRCRRRHGRLVVEVEDAGPGLAGEAARRAFEPGFSTRGGGGCGAGLALARESARAMGGRLHLSQAEGGGTRATLELPG